MLSSCFSPCGKYFVTSNMHGYLRLYETNSLLQDSKNGYFRIRKFGAHEYTFQTEEKEAVYTILSVHDHLIATNMGKIMSWKWKDIIAGDWTLSWTITVPSKKPLEINALTSGPSNEVVGGTVLYAACDDHTIKMFDLETKSLLRCFSKHSEYIHAIAVYGSAMVSGSEDGTVILWDSRCYNNSNVFNPYQYDCINRPPLGKSIGAVDINQEQLIVCGGGARLSLWDRRMLFPKNVFTNSRDRSILVAQFHEKKTILVGGIARRFSHLSYNDDLLTVIPTDGIPIYCCSYLGHPVKLLTVAGYSHKISVCTTLNENKEYESD